MIGLLETATSYFLAWLAHSSLQVSLFILIVLGILSLLGTRLEPRWHCALWVLVLLRMALPWAPATPVSIHNALTPLLSWGEAAMDLKAKEPDVEGADSRPVVIAEESEATEVDESAVTQTEAVLVGEDQAHRLMFYRRGGFWFGAWAAGAVVTGAMLVWNQLALWRAVQGRRPITDGTVLDLFEDCKARMGVGTLLAIVPTDRLHTPALYGLIRPRLLVPQAMLVQLPREQLRHVLLHELAHLKRLDIHMGWLAAVLQVFHWFNPLVWLALARLRVARELACDQKVLAVLGRNESQAYGHTILNLLEYWTKPRRIPGMAGILEERSQLKRRIHMIAAHSGQSGLGSMAALGLAAGLALVGLTNGQTPAAANKDSQAAKPAAKEVMVRYDDDKASGKKSIGAGGHGIEFKRPGNLKFVEAVEIHASRYGEDQAPKEFFHLYILNQDRQILADVPFSYGLVKKGEEKWYRLKTPSVEVTDNFMIGLSFNPHQTKGIYLSYADVDKSHSFVGLPEEGYEPADKPYDWMVRVAMSETPSGQKGTKLLKNWKPPKKAGPFGSCIAIPAKLDPTEEKQSYGGRGPGIELTVDPAKIGNGQLTGDEIMVKGFSVYASRYGSGFDPQTAKVKVAVLDSDKEVRWQGEVPYAAFAFKPAWVNIVLPDATPLSDLAGADNKFILVFDPEAQQRKGIYWHYQKSPQQSHSFAGTIDGGLQPVSDREWLMRVHVEPKAAGNGGARPGDAAKPAATR